VSEISVRTAQRGDGNAIAALSCDAAAYYLEFAPDTFRRPDDDGHAAWLDSFLPADGEGEIALVAEIGGDVGRLSGGQT
jgi:hypothetical protein